MRQRNSVRSVARGWVWLALVLTLVLAGCADEGAAEDVSEAAPSDAAAQTASEVGGMPSEVGGMPSELSGLPTELGGAIEQDPDVIAVCDQFFSDVSSLAQAGDIGAMREAIRVWAEQAQGTAIEAEASAIADMLTNISSGNAEALGQELISASTEFGTQCAMHGWVPSQ
jgi:hypothetical protein